MYVSQTDGRGLSTTDKARKVRASKEQGAS